jgi:hypothetical protein
MSKSLGFFSSFFFWGKEVSNELKLRKKHQFKRGKGGTQREGTSTAPNKLGYIPSGHHIFHPNLDDHVLPLHIFHPNVGDYVLLRPYSGVNQGMYVGGCKWIIRFSITNLCVLSII